MQKLIFKCNVMFQMYNRQNNKTMIFISTTLSTFKLSATTDNNS